MARTSGPEARMYEPVQRWLESKKNCWISELDTGPRIGRIDVVGVRDFGGGDLSSRSEVIAVEVKTANAPFAKSAGQAHGYSVMADRCYLALQRAATDEEQVVASQLGIGLLRVNDRLGVTEDLTAPAGQPLQEFRERLLEKLGCATCSLCATVFQLGTNGKTSTNRVIRRENEGSRTLLQAAELGKGARWWLHTTAANRDTRGRQHTYWRRHLCADCTWALAGGGERT